MLVVCVDMVPYGLRRPNAGWLLRIASAAKADGMGDRDTGICVQTPRNACIKRALLGVFVFKSKERDLLQMIDKPPP